MTTRFEGKISTDFCHTVFCFYGEEEEDKGEEIKKRWGRRRRRRRRKKDGGWREVKREEGIFRKASCNLERRE